MQIHVIIAKIVIQGIIQHLLIRLTVVRRTPKVQKRRPNLGPVAGHRHHLVVLPVDLHRDRDREAAAVRPQALPPEEPVRRVHRNREE